MSHATDATEPALWALVGNTPLVEIARLNPERARGVRVLAKLESRNPGGSVKDRAALAILRDARARGLLASGRGLLDATSGNTGIAYAMLAAPLGLRCKLVMPENASPRRVALLEAYGADVELTDPIDGQDGAIDRAREIAKNEADRWHYADQYANPANPAAHATTTAPEIWRQTDGRVTHFVAGLGTSGTAIGTTRGLKALALSAYASVRREDAPAGAADRRTSRMHDITCIALQPEGPMHGIEGMKHMPTSHVPPIYKPDELDAVRSVRTERALELKRALARDEGLLVGTSSGAALAGALDVAREAPAGSVIVTVFPDGGERYL